MLKNYFQACRMNCFLYHSSIRNQFLPELDISYLCDPRNKTEIETNIRRRNSQVNLNEVLTLNELLEKTSGDAKTKVLTDLISAAINFPNRAHPDILPLGPEPLVVKYIGTKKEFNFKAQTFDNLSEKLRLIRMKNISPFTGHRTYFLMDQLAVLEDALIQYSVSRLIQSGFQLISVPDILTRDVIESCGMATEGERNQVYKLDGRLGSHLCLSGTAEMGIASFLKGKKLKSSELPLRFVSVSRCYRAETSRISEEKGLYRVHQFYKVEMFAVTRADSSAKMLDEFVSIQESLLGELGLFLRVLDMPQEELGRPAHRKFDVEALLLGRGTWAELTSASDCTDYQARRLDLRMDDGFPHTVNGTACAIPRLIIALVETHQNMDRIILPDAIVPFTGFKVIGKSRVPKLTNWKPSELYE